MHRQTNSNANVIRIVQKIMKRLKYIQTSTLDQCSSPFASRSAHAARTLQFVTSFTGFKDN